MPYYTRILTPSRKPIPSSKLGDAIRPLGARLDGEVDSLIWEELEAIDINGRLVVRVERNEVFDGSLAQGEVEDFKGEIAECKPTSASEWLCQYLSSVVTIYVFQIFVDVNDSDSGEIVGTLRDKIWGTVGGIIQADGEGFTNEDGYHILWQFSDRVTGDWWMATLYEGNWKKFKIDLGNDLHRSAFQSGAVPAGVQPID
ncbi:hypothetical protein G6M04_09200 [Agrobacterium rhizogenes]|uniref:hypothetical protein n=1 Tax=Rhizobium rhizogenes TaxID=359 RepID=UPI001571B3DD|nr:hypothetical protein [Rhizobium rhizogenes]NTG47551.1 hypothetical protein [Rhizobium rhizogenes]